MINSILMLASSYIKNRKVAIIACIAWIAYMLIGANLSLGIAFPIVNILVFGVVVFGVRKISNNKLNLLASVISILIWSIAIDVICYFMFPKLTFGQNILQYIGDGILFNIRFVGINVLVIATCKAIKYGVEKVKGYTDKKVLD